MRENSIPFEDLLHKYKSFISYKIMYTVSWLEYDKFSEERKKKHLHNIKMQPNCNGNLFDEDRNNYDKCFF